MEESVDQRVDRAERQHLVADVEADFVDRAYLAAFSAGAKCGPRSDDEAVLSDIATACQGSIRVALLARRRARATWDLNPADLDAGEAHWLLTLAAASFLPTEVDHRSFA